MQDESISSDSGSASSSNTRSSRGSRSYSRQSQRSSSSPRLQPSSGSGSIFSMTRFTLGIRRRLVISGSPSSPPPPPPPYTPLNQTDRIAVLESRLKNMEKELKELKTKVENNRSWSTFFSQFGITL